MEDEIKLDNWNEKFRDKLLKTTKTKSNPKGLLSELIFHEIEAFCHCLPSSKYGIEGDISLIYSALLSNAFT